MSGLFDGFERCGSPDRKDNQSAWPDLSFANGSIGKRRGPAPSGHHRDVLRSVHRVGHRRRRNPYAGVKLPQRLAVGGSIGDKFSVRPAVKHQIPRCRQRSAASRERLVRTPHFAVGNRIPGDQASRGLRLEPLFSHRPAVISVHPRDLIVKINFHVVLRHVDRGAVHYVEVHKPVMGLNEMGCQLCPPSVEGLHDGGVFQRPDRGIFYGTPVRIDTGCPIDLAYRGSLISRVPFSRSKT